MIFIKIFYWILFLLAWIWTLKYRKMIYEWTWRFAWAERYLGNWWTVVVITLIWMLFIFLSVAYPMWIIDFSDKSNGDYNTLEQKYIPEN